MRRNAVFTFSLLLLFSTLSLAAVEKAPYLLFEGKNTQMTVMWQLTNSSSCSIKWGKTTSYEMGTASTSEYGSDHQHRHTITGLTPNTRYHYSVDGVGSGSFRTAPEASAKRTRFIAYGDTRTYPRDHNSVAGQIIQRINSEKELQTCVLFSGDYVSDGYDERDWTDQFFPLNQSNIKKLHSLMPNVGCIGNHEGQDGSRTLRKYYPFPHVKGHYWAFDYGPARVFVIDQYTQSYSTGSSQHNWLKAELAATDKEWKIVIFHAPGYSAGGGHSNNSKVQNYLQPLFEEYGVDFVLNGDNHYYSRAVVNGVTHITTGGGGAPLYSPSSSSQYVKKADKSNHFCELDLNGYTATVTARRASGSVIETFTVQHEGPQFEITVTTPQSADSYVVGSDVSITWEDNIDENVTIELLQESTPLATITADTESDGSFSWNIPDAVDAGSYSIKVSSINDPSINGVSAVFSITEAIDTTDPTNLIPIAGWEVTGDKDGSTFSMESKKILDSTVSVSASIDLVTANDTDKIYPWAKLSGWVTPGNFDSITAIKITYTSTSELQIFLEDSALSKDGMAYEYTIPKTTTLKSLLLTPSMFAQPDWVKEDQQTPLNLKEVTGISFGSTLSDTKADYTLHDVTLCNFTGIPAPVVPGSSHRLAHSVKVTKGSLSLSVGDKPVELQVLTVSGRVLVAKSIKQEGTHRISLSGLNTGAGVYFYRIQNADESITGHILLQ